MTAVGNCPHCQGPLESVTFGHDAKWAVWCPKCNEVWEPTDTDQPPEPDPPLDKTLIIWPRMIKNTILARKAEQQELDRIHRDSVRQAIRQEIDRNR